MDEGRRRPGEMQKLLNNGRHKEMKPSCKVLQGKKHSIVFSTHSGLIRLLHQFEFDVIKDIVIGPQLKVDIAIISSELGRWATARLYQSPIGKRAKDSRWRSGLSPVISGWELAVGNGHIF